MIKIADLMKSSGVAFGTSGARGTVQAMTNPVCYAYTLGFLQAMQAEGVLSPGSAVLIAGDLRSSTPRILAAVARAVDVPPGEAEPALAVEVDAVEAVLELAEVLRVTPEDDRGDECQVVVDPEMEGLKHDLLELLFKFISGSQNPAHLII